MAYTTIDKPSDYFETKLYTGNGGTQSITGLDFQPDWCWLKARAGANVSNHRSVDSVRSATKELFQDATAAEETNTNGLTAFNSNGFSLGSSGGTNNSNTTYASWNWKAGTSFTNDASGTGIGTIDSAGSVSTASGFSIVSWTGTGSAGTIAHGFGKLPKMIIAKQRNSTANWVVYFLDTTIANNNVNNYLELNTTIASTGDSGARWGAYANYSTTTFGVGTDAATNADGSTYIAYVFSDIQGYSKFSSYTGNGNADGNFIYTGFKPAFIMIKRTDAAADWEMYDNKRDGFNDDNPPFYANTTGAEGSNDRIDILSNGFKIRASSGNLNASGGTYIYMAFAENPFVTSTGVPATAR